MGQHINYETYVNMVRILFFRYFRSHLNKYYTFDPFLPNLYIVTLYIRFLLAFIFHLDPIYYAILLYAHGIAFLEESFSEMGCNGSKKVGGIH